MSNEVNALREEVAGLRKLLVQLGIAQAPRPEKVEERPDYIGHGTKAHAKHIGLILVGEDEKVPEETIVMQSSATGQRYRLEDEIAACGYVPGIDPEKAIRHILRQKINTFEMPVEPPEKAPEMWQPVDEYATLLTV